jgi:hypothetical protein
MKDEAAAVEPALHRAGTGGAGAPADVTLR